MFGSSAGLKLRQQDASVILVPLLCCDEWHCDIERNYDDDLGM